MLPSDQIVALVRHDTDVGRQIVEGQVELPYDRAAQVIVAGITDPMARVGSAAILDAHAAVELTAVKLEL